MTAELLAEIRARLEACPIPAEARPDWDGTNHYEIQDVSASTECFWWLDGALDAARAGSSSEEGRRLGAVLDYACAYRRDVGVLLAEVDALPQTGGDAAKDDG